MKIFIASLIFLSFCGPVSAEYIKSWYICGPFPNGTLDTPCFKNEGKVVPSEGLTSGGLKWRIYSGKGDSIDFNSSEIFGSNENSNCFAYAEVVSEEDRKAVLLVGSDDGVRVWLNGEMILTNDIGRGLEKDQDKLNIALKEGANHLTFKINNRSGGWNLAARIAGVDGEDISGIRYLPRDPFAPLRVQDSEASTVETDPTSKEVYNTGKAFDGDPATRWSSEHSDRQYLIADLGTSARISGVGLKWEAAFGKAYTIEISRDKTEWKTVYTAKDGKGGTESIKFEPVEGRYVKLNMTERGTTFGYSLYEFSVSGETLPEPDEAIKLKKIEPCKRNFNLF